MADEPTREFLAELRDSLQRLQRRIDHVLGEPAADRRCSQCNASLVGKRRDARTCGSAECKRAEREARLT